MLTHPLYSLVQYNKSKFTVKSHNCIRFSRKWTDSIQNKTFHMSQCAAYYSIRNKKSGCRVFKIGHRHECNLILSKSRPVSWVTIGSPLFWNSAPEVVAFSPSLYAETNLICLESSYFCKSSCDIRAAKDTFALHWKRGKNRISGKIQRRSDKKKFLKVHWADSRTVTLWTPTSTRALRWRNGVRRSPSWASLPHHPPMTTPTLGILPLDPHIPRRGR